MKRLSWVHYALPVLALALLALGLDSTRAYAAVSISAFNAQPQTTTILVRWTTASELNNAGFNLYRSTLPTGSFSKINSSIIPVKNPGSIIGSSYTYSDNTAIKGQTYYYKLESVEFGGGTQQFGPVNATIADPSPTPTTAPPTPTRTPTAQPTATRTSTSVPTTQVPSTATATSVAAGPTATRPAAVSEPTRVAVFVEPATPTRAAPARARSSNSSAQPPAPPKSSDPVSVPTTASVAQNLGSQNSQSESSDSTDESALEETLTQPSLPSPLLVMIMLLAGFAMETAIAAGAVAFYLIAQKLIG